MAPRRRRRAARSSRPLLLLLALLAAAVNNFAPAGGVEVLAKSRLESCARGGSDDGRDRLTCDSKIVVDLAVPSGSSGGEASLVARVAEVEENGTEAGEMPIRDPLIITINKSEVYALYDLTYLRDVAYKPEEKYVKTRKCEPEAGANVVKSCESLFAALVGLTAVSLHLVETFLIKWRKEKLTQLTVYVFQMIGFMFLILGEDPFGSEVIVGPENRTVVSEDSSLRVNLVGDFAGYTSLPSLENFYLVTPRKGVGGGQLQVLGDDFSRWMLLERVLFTLDGLECNKIGVGYEAFRSQPNFCSSPLDSCLGDQLSKFWEIDKNRVNNSQPPQYVVLGKFERINQYPNAGVHTFSVGIPEVLNTNLMIELSADDIEYVYQRSSGKIISINISSFEALSQVGSARVKTKNIGRLEASYSLTFDCLSGINPVEEQYFIMKPDEKLIRTFDLRSSTDQASNYTCQAILKASDFSELDRKESRFSTTATVLNNGTQVEKYSCLIIADLEFIVLLLLLKCNEIGSSENHTKGGIWGFFEAIKAWCAKMWHMLINFFTGTTCRSFSCGSTRCWSFLKFVIHGLLLVAVLWLLHRKGLFDPLYYWWDGVVGSEAQERARRRHKRAHSHRHSHHHDAHKRHKTELAGHRRHHVLHIHDDDDPVAAAAAAEHVILRRHGRHEAALGVQHRDGLKLNKHRLHGGKAVALLPPGEIIVRDGGGCGGVEHGDRRHHAWH
uniref:Generative cell specific-1/HAP2 domain-containing protein n=1 Tax=Oryza glumipatula TaxID=40148 RepID=A0A0E0B5J4_9ORYZ